MWCKEQEKLIKTEDVLPLLEDIASKKQEHFVVLTLDSEKRLITRRVVFIGTVNAVIVHPREVFAGALEDRAVSIIAAHNHPSGNPEPSKADEEMTQQLVAAGQILAIKLDDHIVIVDDGYFSFSEQGLL